MIKTLRDYQEDAVNSVFSYNGNPLIVVPTGGGKSLIQAEIVKKITNSGLRVLCLAHRKELIEQNEKSYFNQTGKRSGIYAASLNSFDYGCSSVLFGQIQSISKITERYLRSVSWDYVIIDEAHMVTENRNGMHRKVICNLLSVNPKLKVIGLTATPFRTKDGPIYSYDGAIFDGVSYEIKISYLISKGYLSNIVSRSGVINGDIDYYKGFSIEYRCYQLVKCFNKDEITDSAIDEICFRGKDRSFWLLFGVNVDHAKSLLKKLQQKGISSGIVHSKMSNDERDKVVSDARSGKIKALVNCDILTTGFDLPCVDLIALVRATKSLGLFIQMVGRGMRLSHGKDNLLLLDYGRNVERHGLLDSIGYVTSEFATNKKKNEKAKECPDCGRLAPITYQKCQECGYIFSKGSGGYDNESYGGEIIAPSNVRFGGYYVDGLRAVSRMEVKSLGRLSDSFYFDGIKCRHGHLSPRYVSYNTCVACATHNQYKNKSNFNGDRLAEKVDWRVYGAFIQLKHTIIELDRINKTKADLFTTNHQKSQTP